MYNNRNRFANINPELSDNRLEENLKVDNENDLLNYLERVSYNIKSDSNILEQYSTLNKLLFETFETDIEKDMYVDFIEESFVNENNYMTFVNEDVKERTTKYHEDMIKAIDSTIEVIESKSVKASSRIDQIIKSDVEKYDKYKKALQQAKTVQGFKGIKNFKFTNSNTDNRIKQLGELKVHKYTLPMTGKEAKKWKNNYSNIINNFANLAFERYKVWKPKDNELANIIKLSTDAKDYKVLISSCCKEAANQIKKLKDTAEKLYKHNISHDDSVDIVKATNNLFYATTYICMICLKSYDSFIRVLTLKLITTRAAFLSLGRYVSSDAAKNESAEEAYLSNSVIYETCIEYITNKMNKEE